MFDIKKLAKSSPSSTDKSHFDALSLSIEFVVDGIENHNVISLQKHFCVLCTVHAFQRPFNQCLYSLHFLLALLGEFQTNNC